MNTKHLALRLADTFGLFKSSSHVIEGEPVHTLAADELRRLYAENEKLRAFAQDIMDEWPDVGTLDGFDLQELAVKHGLLAETTHHKPCAEEGCNCASMVDERDWIEGVQCYRGTALLKGAV